MATTTPTTLPRPHLNLHLPKSLHVHVHLPHHLAAICFALVFVVAFFLVVGAAAKTRAKRRQNIIEALVADAKRLLHVDVFKARPSFGKPAAQWHGKTLECLHCTYGKGASDAQTATQVAMKDTVCHRLGYAVTIEWNHPKHAFTISRVPPIPPLPARVDHPAKLEIDQRHPYLIPIGVTHGGEAVSLDLDGPDPHLLTVGKTRSGKSALLATVGVAACRRHMDVRVCDIKRVSLAALKDFPGVTVHAVNLADIVAVIADVEAEMVRRYAAMDAGTRRVDLIPLLLIVDEAAQLSQIPGAEKVGDSLASLARQGGYARVHLALGFQQASAMFFGKAATEARGNYGVTVALGKMSTIAMGMVGIEMPVPVHPRGRAVVATSDGEQEVQVYWTPSQGAHDLSPADAKLLRSLRPEAVPIPRRDPEVAEATPIPAVLPANALTNAAPTGPVNKPTNGLPDALPVGTVQHIRNLRSEGLSIRAIAAEVGVSVAAVHKYSKVAE